MSDLLGKLLTSDEVCEWLGVSRKTLQLLRRNRKIAFVRLGHRSIRFRGEAVEEFLRKREKAIAFADQNLSQNSSEVTQ